MKLNNKGFSFIEIIGVIFILGLILTLAVIEYRKYMYDTLIKSYDFIAESASEAAEEYLMDQGELIDSINFDELVEGGYLEEPTDMALDNGICTGTVNVTSTDAEGINLATNEYSVSICCHNYNYTYSFPGGNKVEDKNGCRAAVNTLRLIETKPEVNCLDDTTKSKTVLIYVMDYIGKNCIKNSYGYYTDNPNQTSVNESDQSCYNSVRDNTRQSFWQTNNPCRKYKYKDAKCKCVYSKNTNRFCSSSTSNISEHTMRIRYYDTPEGINACTSNDPRLINSYVDRVCTYGSYVNYSTSPGVMTFHGYQFFQGLSVGFTDFRPDGSWFHDGGSYDERVTRGVDISGQPNYEDGCRRTCIMMTEKWSGLVDYNLD